MQKGFGFYSPHETTILFLKASLVSIWLGLDLVVVLVVGSLPQSMLDRHAIALNIAGAVLATGTVFSLLFAWATGTLFGRADNDAVQGKDDRLGKVCRVLKRKPYHLIGAGIACIVLVMLAVGWFVFGAVSIGDADRPIGRANLDVARKCAEVATMEYSLFRADERIVMTQCMLQYDPTYASLRGS